MRTIQRFKKSGLRPGFPDLIIKRNGEIRCAELKSKRGRLPEKQRQWRDFFQQNHFRWIEVRSLEDLRDGITTFLTKEIKNEQPKEYPR